MFLALGEKMEFLPERIKEGILRCLKEVGLKRLTKRIDPDFVFAEGFKIQDEFYYFTNFGLLIKANLRTGKIRFSILAEPKNKELVWWEICKDKEGIRLFRPKWHIIFIPFKELRKNESEFIEDWQTVKPSAIYTFSFGDVMGYIGIDTFPTYIGHEYVEDPVNFSLVLNEYEIFFGLKQDELPFLIRIRDNLSKLIDRYILIEEKGLYDEGEDEFQPFEVESMKVYHRTFMGITLSMSGYCIDSLRNFDEYRVHRSSFQHKGSFRWIKYELR